MELYIVMVPRPSYRWLITYTCSQTGKWILHGSTPKQGTQLMAQVMYTARAFLMYTNAYVDYTFFPGWLAGRTALTERQLTRTVYCILFWSQIFPARVGVTILDLGLILNAFPDQFYAVGGLRSIVLNYSTVLLNEFYYVCFCLFCCVINVLALATLSSYIYCTQSPLPGLCVLNCWNLCLPFSLDLTRKPPF